jgi:hypothetical protein
MKIFPRFQYDEETGGSACRNQRVNYCIHSTGFNQMYYYRGPGFLADVWFGSSSIPSSLYSQQVVSLSQSSFASPVDLTDGREGGGDGGGAKSSDGETVWSSLKHSILSVCAPLTIGHIPFRPRKYNVRLCFLSMNVSTILKPFTLYLSSLQDFLKVSHQINLHL